MKYRSASTSPYCTTPQNYGFYIPTDYVNKLAMGRGDLSFRVKLSGYFHNNVITMDDTKPPKERRIYRNIYDTFETTIGREISRIISQGPSAELTIPTTDTFIIVGNNWSRKVVQK